MRLWTLKLRETVRALGVVALVFLNFGHAPMAVGAELVASSYGASFCGGPVDPVDAPGHSDSAPCEVCLLGSGMDLPPPPAGSRSESAKRRPATSLQSAAKAPPGAMPVRSRGRLLPPDRLP